jgi:hypothetical protein
VLRVLRASIAPFLLLITPFTIFVQHQRYGVSHPEVLLVVLALTAAALLLGAGAARWQPFEVVVIALLLVLFIDIQVDEVGEKRLLIAFLGLGTVLWLLRQHAAQIVSLMVATMLVVSFLTPQSEGAQVSAAGAAAPTAHHGDLPFILHLILDEHIGVEGLPADLTPPAFTRDFESFFVQRGFRLFGRAYSEYPATVWSIAQLLNLAPNGYTPSLTTAGGADGTFRLTRSAYFDRLSAQGYAIRVYRSDYLDMCTTAVPAAACYVYRESSLGELDGLRVATREKVAVVAGAYVSRSELYTRAKGTYMAARQPLLRAGIPLPAWDWERSTAAPLATMPVFDKIAADLSRAQRGEVVFAHLLMPHYPYVYGAGCEARPPSEWLARSDAVDPRIPDGITNSPDSRAARYARYFDQIRCTQRKIEQLLDAIPEPVRRDAIVIVQGDHGSRISLVEPSTTAAGSLVPSDYADYFSTLFAVRAPEVKAGYDTHETPITCLLRSLARSDFRSVEEGDSCATSPVVHFWDGNGPPKPRPLPEFWNRNVHSARLR